MSTTETVELPRLADDGEPCEACGSPLAGDQRYCLNCGARRGEPRVAYESAPIGADSPAEQKRAGGDRDVTPLGAVVGIAILGVMLLVGVLIGRGGEEQSAPQVVTAVGPADGATAAAGASETVSNAGAVKSDWPEGKEGWTVDLGELPKSGTTAADVEATKADVESRGAADVGVLDSDLYGSLPGGNYVVYSGVFDSEGEAEKALDDLKADFPDATVIEVAEKASGGGGGSSDGDALISGENANNEGIVEASEADLQALENVTGEDYQEALKKLPDQIETPGKPPPIDTSKPAGGGTEAEVID